MICIGIDESYQDTGITVNYNNGKKLKCYSYKGNKKDGKSTYRLGMKILIQDIIHEIKKKNEKEDIVIVVERIRQFSARFISMPYITSMSALIGCIIDSVSPKNIPVYSVDTRCWKSNIVGTSKPLKNTKGIDPKKYPTYKWCINNGYEKYVMEKKQLKSIKVNNHKYVEIYNDNIGDSIAISFAWFNNNCKNKLKVE